MACAGDAGETDAAPVAVFVLDRGEDAASFFDLPWPTDLRTTDDGLLDVADFPNPNRNRNLRTYLDALGSRRGWGTNGAIYFRTSRPINPRSLPRDPASSQRLDASAFLMDVDAESPDRGTLHPVTFHYRDEATLYWPDHAIVMRPLYGRPLAPNRTYAAVLTTDLEPLTGGRFARDADFEALLVGAGDATVARASDVYEPVIAALEEAGFEREALLAMAVFTTQDPVGELIALRDWITTRYPEPTAVTDRWRWVGERREGYTELEGAYGPSPDFELGPSPFDTAPSGQFEYDASGDPVVQEDLVLRFRLSIPHTPMPENGYPIVLYAHGTGGDYGTFLRSGVATLLAAEGYAVMGIDQVLHGDRNPTDFGPELLFFNIFNPYAVVNNTRQAALDVVQQARFAATVEVPTDFVSRDDRPVRFDASRMVIYGHSQGGLTMPLFLAVDDQTRGGVLSAAGGTFLFAVIDKKEPFDILSAAQLLLSLPGSNVDNAVRQEHFVYEHPILTLLQTWVEPLDAVNYASLLFHRPRPGFAPKSVLQIQGRLDLYTPPNAAYSLAAAAHIPVIAPISDPIEALSLDGIGADAAPARGNVAGGDATAGLLQFPGGDHFVARTSPVARYRIAGFLRSFDDGVPTIPAP